MDLKVEDKSYWIEGIRYSHGFKIKYSLYPQGNRIRSERVMQARPEVSQPIGPKPQAQKFEQWVQLLILMGSRDFLTWCGMYMTWAELMTMLTYTKRNHMETPPNSNRPPLDIATSFTTLNSSTTSGISWYMKLLLNFSVRTFFHPPWLCQG